MKPTKEKLFFFDCEWVPIAENLAAFEILYPELYKAFLHQYDKKKGDIIPERKGLEEKGDGMTLQEFWETKAHFYPEFCKIICVSYGYYYQGNLVIKSVYGEDEKKLLSSLPEMFNKVEDSGLFLCGYAIKRFDMPWLSKRMMANGIKPPRSIFMYGRKPWEVDVFDLPEVWGQGSMGESYTPFELACAALGIESSKGELDGSKVKFAFWDGRIEEIKNYCEKDVRKSAELAEKLINLMP